MRNEITWDFQRSAACSRYYASKGGEIVASIEKYDETRSETHPFKVSLWNGVEFNPNCAFWPDFDDYLNSKKNDGKSYFKAAFGGFSDAKKYVTELFAN